MNKKLSLALIAFSVFGVAFSVACRLFLGTGKENLIYQATGIYNGHMLLGFLVLFLASLAVNNFVRSAMISAIFSKDDAGRLWLYKEIWPRSTLLIALNFSIFIIFSFLYFHHLEGRNLFLDVDGDYMLSLARQQGAWMGTAFYFSANFLQGVGGNIWFPLNTLIDPGYIVGNIGSIFNSAAAHTTWSLLLFTSTLVLARTIQWNWNASFFAAWLVCALVIFPSHFQLSPVPQLIPHLLTSISVSTLMISLIIMESPKKMASVYRSLFLTALAVYFFLHNPTFLLVAFPVVCFCGLMKIALCKDNACRLEEIVVFGLPVLFIAISGGLIFVAGLYLNTAVHFFPDDFMIFEKGLSSISSLLSKTPQRLVGIFVVLGLFSAILSNRNEKGFKALSLAGLFMCVLLMLLGTIYVINPEIWEGPSINYFEFMLWPLYSIFIVYFVLRLFAFMHLETIRTPFKVNDFALRLSPFLVPVCVVSFFSLYSLNIEKQRHWAFPPPASEIMDHLAALSVRQGENSFKGRVATFTGQHIEKPVSWLDLQKMDRGIMREVDNDFRKAGLWYYGIPTLAEYNQLITPRFHYFAKNIFERENDLQVRNIMTLRKVVPEYLKLMGVSRLIIDKEMGGYKRLATKEAGTSVLYLYEIPDSNLNGYSPVEVQVIENFGQGLEYLRSEDFNPLEDVLLETPIEYQELTPVYENQIEVGGNFYKVRAKSEGVSLLVLPVEYSSCWVMDSKTSGGLNPQILPANILFAAILFEKDIEATLRYKNGPFTNPSCRFKDYKVFKDKIK